MFLSFIYIHIYIYIYIYIYIFMGFLQELSFVFKSEVFNLNVSTKIQN